MGREEVDDAVQGLRGAPESFLGKACRRGLVDWPAETLSRLTRGQVICWLGFALAVWAAVEILGGDAIPVMGGAMPDTLAWLATFDVSILADALVAAALIATQTRLGGLKARLRASLGLARPRTGARRRAPRRRRTDRPKAGNDDDERPAFALAA